MDSEERILQLEKQVKGLMDTVTQLYKAYGLQALNIPRPDQYVESGGHAVDNSDIANILATQDDFDPLEDEIVTETATIFRLPRYKYLPLDEASSEIRILALEKSQSLTDPIRCRLITASLDSCSEYRLPWDTSPIQRFTPLSYCWGTASMTEYIIVDGCSFLVTPSLYGALMHFRKGDHVTKDPDEAQNNQTETYWWIDAICIDQSNLEERNSQVGLMSRLYRHALVAHVWLGDQSDDSARAIQAIRQLGYAPAERDEEVSWRHVSKPGQTHRPDGPGRPMKRLPAEATPTSEEEKVQNYIALRNLYQRPWFSRVWIRQEVALPKDIKFHCGTETCSWEEIMRTADLLTYLVDEYHLPALQQQAIRRDDSSTSCFHEAVQLIELRNKFRVETDYGELEDLVLRFRDCQATDPRDKIYAALPLTDPDVMDIKADYRKEKVEVYKEVTLSLIANSGLEYLTGCQNPSRSNGLPSWVPDLDTRANPRRPAYNIDHQRCLETSHRDPENDFPNFTYVPEHSRLDIQGVIFDQFTGISHTSCPTADMSNADVRKIVNEWRRFYADRVSDPSECYQDLCGPLYWDDQDWVPLFQMRNDEDRIMGRRRERGCVRFERLEDVAVDHDRGLKIAKALLPLDDTPFSKVIGNVNEYLSEVRPLCVGRKLVFTAQKGFALFPAEANAGDEVCFFDGCKHPFVIRQVNREGTWVIVGQAYYVNEIQLINSEPQLKKTVIRIV